MATDRTCFWDDKKDLPTVAITRWDGKGFTSIEITGEAHEELGIFVASMLHEIDSPATAIRVMHRAGFMSATMTRPPAVVIDAYGKKRDVEMAVVTACLAWKREREGKKDA